MRICAYVQESYARANYKSECLDTRQFVGLKVVLDALDRAGYAVDWAGMATVHTYDVVLVSLTSDCDWWPFIQERLKWQRGKYKVIVGGAGVLHVTPFIRFADYFCLGRGECSVVDLVKALDGANVTLDDSIIEAETFSDDRIYHIKQTTSCYPHNVAIDEKHDFLENAIGCPHKCFFCGYTWHRKFLSEKNYYAHGTGLFNMEDRERAMLDLMHNGTVIDFSHLRSTAIDGCSERLRRMANKPISHQTFILFLRQMLASEAKPHQIKLFNIVGFPTETQEDYDELADALQQADADSASGKQWSVVISSTHFRPMPATPMACAPMCKKNLRGVLHSTIGRRFKGGLLYQGRGYWAVEGMGTESLAPVMLSAIAHRGASSDAENIARLCSTRKFWSADSITRQMTLERYFDMDKLFGSYSRDTLPSRYLRTYAEVEKFWPEEANDGV